MTLDASTACRDVLNRLRAQVNAHLPPVILSRGELVAESIVPLDRLPMIGQVVQQLIEAEAVYVSAIQAVEQGGSEVTA